MFKLIRDLVNRNEDNLKSQVAVLQAQLSLLREDYMLLEQRNCKSCETLRQQLEFVNNEKIQLMETLIQLTRPTVHIPTEEVKILDKVNQAKGTFSRRRGLLENMHKKREETLVNSPFIAKVGEMDRASIKDVTPQSVEELEAQLGVVDENGVNRNASQVG